VISNSKGPYWSAQSSSSVTKTLKSLWASHFMDKVPIYINQTSPVFLLMHNMRIPDFIKQGFWVQHTILLITVSEETVL
jgi:hypothetical protein